MSLIFLFTLLVSLSSASESVTTIAVIDTGFGWDQSLEAKQTKALCKYGHKDFSRDQKFIYDLGTVDPVPLDTHGHGTNIAGVIDKYASEGQKPFCLVILKFYSSTGTGQENLEATIKAIQHAKNIKASMINYSGGGILKSDTEKKAITDYLDQGGVFVAAAGNESMNIDFFHFYPASYDKRIVVVGYKESNEPSYKSGKKLDYTIAKISNYGNGVSRWEFGKNIIGYGVYMSGTSQATAIATGKIAAEWKKDMIQATKVLHYSK